MGWKERKLPRKSTGWAGHLLHAWMVFLLAPGGLMVNYSYHWPGQSSGSAVVKTEVLGCRRGHSAALYLPVPEIQSWGS